MTAIAVTAPARAERLLGIYVHWPFCARKCPYCDFNSHVREAVDEARFRAALLRDIDWGAELLEGEDRAVASVFFGGGTPSLMSPDTVGAVLERLARHWPVAPDVEVTLEANPSSAEAGKFRGYRAAGVNRLSLGVQALHDEALKFLGRLHGAAEALAALDAGRSVFGRVSFDLIYARPGQRPEEWREELRRALGYGTEHLSLYQLTIEPGTAFHGLHRRGELTLPDDDDAAALYDLTQELCEAAGLSAYEISNHARPGALCRHNRDGWRGEDYLGVGPGAHGRVTLDGRTVALHQARLPEAWLRQVEIEGHGNVGREPVEVDARCEELLLYGLRLTEGVDAARFAALAGRSLASVVDPARLARLAAAGYLDADDGGIRATPEGRLRLNAVIGALLA
ncbi:MAG: radical SAM family heme chaperone HemW [Acetobacterales bacterium]